MAVEQISSKSIAPCSSVGINHSHHSSLFERMWNAFCKAMQDFVQWIQKLMGGHKKEKETTPAPVAITETQSEPSAYLSLQLKPDDEKKIDQLLNDLCQNLFYINWNIKSIEAAHEAITSSVHPLKFLEYILKNKADQLGKIHAGPGIVWGKLLKKIYLSLQSHEKASNISAYLPGFAKALDVDPMALRKLIRESGSWKGLSQSLIEWKIGKKSLDLGHYTEESSEQKIDLPKAKKSDPLPRILDAYLMSYQPLMSNNTERLWKSLKESNTGFQLALYFAGHTSKLSQLLQMEGYGGLPSLFKHLFLLDLERHFPIAKQNLQAQNWQSVLEKITHSPQEITC